MTRSSEVSRVEPTSAMVTRSRARKGRGGNAVPEVELRPETETDSYLRGRFGSHIDYADKPETAAAY